MFLASLHKRKRASKKQILLPILSSGDGYYYCSAKEKRMNSRTATICQNNNNVITSIPLMIISRWFFLGGFLSMLTRCIAIYQSPYNLHDLLYLPLLLGMVQDLAIIIQAIIIMQCLHRCILPCTALFTAVEAR